MLLARHAHAQLRWLCPPTLLTRNVRRISVIKRSSGGSEVGPKEHKRKAAPPEEEHVERRPAGGLQAFDEGEGEEQFLSPYMNACIKVYATHCEPNYSLPWSRKRQMTSTSSGFIATYQDKRYLLTNAHSVDYHTQVRADPCRCVGTGLVFLISDTHAAMLPCMHACGNWPPFCVITMMLAPIYLF